MYKVDYGKNAAAAPPPNASANNNAAPAGFFAVRPTQAPPPQTAAQPPVDGSTYPAQPAYNAQGYPAYPQAAPQQPQPYYPQAQPYYPQSQPPYQPQGYNPQMGYQPQQAYPPNQRGSQPHLQPRGGGWQPSVMSMPTYTQQHMASQPSMGASSKQGKSQCLRIQLLLQAALHAACAGTFLGIEIWAIYIKAWLANVALGIWLGFTVYIACAAITILAVCRPLNQKVLHVTFGFMIAGTIVGVGLAAIAGVGISYENNINYTLRDNFWPYRVPTHIVKMICAVIEIVVCLWELLIVKTRFEEKAHKPRRAPSVAASYRAGANNTQQRSAGAPDVLSGFSMPSSVVLSSTGPQQPAPPSRAFKELPVAPDLQMAEQKQAEAQAAYAPNAYAAERDDDTHTVETSGGETEPETAPPPRPSRPRGETPQYDAPVPAPVPPRPTKRSTKPQPEHSDDDEASERPPERPAGRPGRKAPPPPPENNYDQPNVPQPSAYDDPFAAPITRPAQAGGTQKRFYQYTDN